MDSPRSSRSIRRGSWNTGFPEPFCGVRNTTLPHPDANLSPDAVISQDDVAPTKALSRTRRSFLVRNRRTISHGRIKPAMEAMYSMQLTEEEEDEHGLAMSTGATPSMAALPLDGNSSEDGRYHNNDTQQQQRREQRAGPGLTVSLDRSSKEFDGRHSLGSTNGGDMSPTSSTGSSARRKGLLSRLFRHK